MQSYSMDLRQRVLDMAERGEPTRRIAEALSVSRSWVRRVRQRQRECGEVAPRPRGGARTVKIDRQRLAELVAEQPDATLAELRERLGVEVSRSAICMALKQLKLTFKKRPSTPPSRTGPTSPRSERPGG